MKRLFILPLLICIIISGTNCYLYKPFITKPQKKDATAPVIQFDQSSGQTSTTQLQKEEAGINLTTNTNAQSETSTSVMTDLVIGCLFSLSSQNYQNAIDNCTKAIQLKPDNAFAYLWRGQAYYALNNYQTAIDDFTKVIELKPDAEVYYRRGAAYAALNNYQAAINDCTKAIELQPDFADAYFVRGLAYAELGLPTTACDDFYNAGLLYLKAGQKTEALKCVDLMKKTEPHSPLIKKLMNKIYSKDKSKGQNK